MPNIEIKIKQLKAMMLEVAEDILYKNPSKSRDEEFKELREDILDTDREDIFQRLPECISIYETRQGLNSFLKSEFSSYRSRRDYVKEQFENILNYLRNVSENTLNETVLETLDVPHIKKSWNLALEVCNNDPENAAINAGKMLESVCKHILDFENITYTKRDTLGRLFSKVEKFLDFDSDANIMEMGEVAKNSKEIVRLIRNQASHGSNSPDIKLQPYHAEFTINLAGSLCVFLMSFWQETKQ